ncbi:MAG: NADPH:quinone oxidoreductase family protein [Kofleriaceae bacterium]|nr:NADPH:quinone oxidoreductase family protein [Myxococcales bacterium]MCB9561148.1 NADPH:quinone oxidoreductase family protein [Kofleriaceae bacterium]MCB9571346.1 NADPH:quinone oxidoreductase family protein [Kofleriaceae bacterium]
MRAWRAHDYGPYRDVLRYEEVDRPELPEAGVILKVEAAALNFPDLLAIAGKYQVKAPLPFIPGMECAGTVVEAGARSRHQPGDRVIASTLWGAFAEELAVADPHLLPVPSGMTAAQAASFLITYQTAYFALVHRTTLRAGETLLVHGGAGGVGVSAIQLGRALGATVIATAGSDAKCEVCTRAGAHHVINYHDDDFVAAVNKLTGGKGADVIYDPVGGDVFDKSLKCIAWEGRLLVIGFASGRIPELKVNRVLLKNVSVVGLFWGAYAPRDPAKIVATHEALSAHFARGEVTPMIWKELPLAELPAGLAALESRASWGKVVVTP